MNYLESVTYIESLSPTLERPSLDRIALFMSECGNPQHQLPVFHVGGTNGKGSTVAILDSILRQGGFKVGCFTGPHLLRWNERFHVSGTPITDSELAQCATEIRFQSESFAGRHAQLGPLTWFEFLTAMAFHYFAQQAVDIVVLEVGLGGRFDATNVVNNVLASIITNIDLDHTHILGDTLSQIAFEKSGIMRTGRPVVTAAQAAGLEELIKQASVRGACLFQAHLPFELKPLTANPPLLPRPGQNWGESAASFENAVTRLILPGLHQRLNALAAVAAVFLAEQYGPSKACFQNALTWSTLEKAFNEVYWPGRMQLVSPHNLILDAAHNPAGARALRSALDSLFPGSPLTFVLSCFGNKNGAQLLQELIHPGDRLYISEASGKRTTFPKDKLAAIADEMGAHAQVFNSLSNAFQSALADTRGPIVATGSFATLREVMKELGWQSVEDGLSSCAVAKLGRQRPQLCGGEQHT